MEYVPVTEEEKEDSGEDTNTTIVQPRRSTRKH